MKSSGDTGVPYCPYRPHVSIVPLSPPSSFTIPRGEIGLADTTMGWVSSNRLPRLGETERRRQCSRSVILPWEPRDCIWKDQMPWTTPPNTSSPQLPSPIFARSGKRRASRLTSLFLRRLYTFSSPPKLTERRGILPSPSWLGHTPPTKSGTASKVR